METGIRDGYYDALKGVGLKRTKYIVWRAVAAIVQSTCSEEKGTVRAQLEEARCSC